MHRQLVLVGGLPGSGKTTYVNRGWPKEHYNEGFRIHLETDQYFTLANGFYNFQPSKLGEAHTDCQLRAFNCMADGVPLVIISNTFSQFWERAIYERFAEHFGYSVQNVDLFDNGLTNEELAARNVHGVPVEVIAAMRERWERWLA